MDEPVIQQNDLRIRLAELIGVLALAIDLGMGQPLEWVLKGCWLGMQLCQALKLDEAQRRDVYYLTLLRHVGCTATASTDAVLLGDELEIGKVFSLMDEANMGPALRFILANLGREMPPLQRLRLVSRFFTEGPRAGETGSIAHCEIAERFAAVLQFPMDFQKALWHIYERWDGNGRPHHLKGEQIALPARIAYLSLDTAFFYLLSNDAKTTLETISSRIGRYYDPSVANLFLSIAPEMLARLETVSAWVEILALEPGKPIWLAGDSLDNALTVLADFGDLKSPFFSGHSRQVALLSKRAAEKYGLPVSEVTAIYRAALLHDVGKVGISASIWNKATPLDDTEWEQVRLHPYYTERICAKSAVLAPLGALAALHHERLDGSGYYRRLPAALQPVTARILAAANAYCSFTENRPHRAACSAALAATRLKREVHEDRLDPDAVRAVLQAAGQRADIQRSQWHAELSPRELEVLQLIAQGLSNRQMATKLVLSEKTISRHIERLYSKIGVSTRAAATLFAVQNGLLFNLDAISP